MKRGNGPQRKTPLRSVTPITAKQPKKPSRPKHDPTEKPTRDIVMKQRSDGVCEVQYPGLCEGAATNYQHRVNRSQGGGYSPGSGLAVCGSGTTGCHGWITGHPEEAYVNGWSVRSWENPLTKPVLYRGHWVVLDDAGSYTPALDFGQEAA